MKEVRPSTWVLLGVLVLIIFGPLFLLDIDPIQQLAPTNHAPNVRPSNPRPTNRPTPANKPEDVAPPTNEDGENGRLPDNTHPENGPLE